MKTPWSRRVLWFVVSVCVGCAPPASALRKGGFLSDYSNVEGVPGLVGVAFYWVDPTKDLRQAQSLAIPDLQHINPAGETAAEVELRQAEVTAAKKVVDQLAERLRTDGVFARVERSANASVDLILQGAVTDFIPLRWLGQSRGRIQVEAVIIEARTGQVVARIQATGDPGMPQGLLQLAIHRDPEEQVIIHLRDFLRDKVKKLKDSR